MEQFNLKQKRGFTLVEMLIAMAIFVTFTAILISSYTSIIRSQREANNYRIMYTEARKVFDTLVQELRDGMVDYSAYPEGTLLGGLSQLQLVSKDDSVKTNIRYLSPEQNNDSYGVIGISKSRKDHLTGAYSPFSEFVNLNSMGINISDFKFYISPVIDPYNVKYVNYDANQFQPKVTVYARFQRVTETGRTFEMDLQTTVSSRIYNQVYQP